MTRKPASPPRGVLRAQSVNGDHQRWLPAVELADVVEHFWFVRWDQSTSNPVQVSTLPHPSIHIVFEQGCAAELAGIHHKRFVRTLAGRGQVFGVKFRPAGFFPFCGQSQKLFCNRRLMLTQIWPTSGASFEQAIANQNVANMQMQIAEHFLNHCQRVDDHHWHRIRDWVEMIRDDRQLLRVEQLAEHAPLSPRQLQRLFLHYLGVPPKWVIQRYRLHEVLAKIEHDKTPDWVSLALQLGYTDQSHFVRDFRASTGMSPTAYVLHGVQ